MNPSTNDKDISRRPNIDLRILSPSTEVDRELYFPCLPISTTIAQLKDRIQKSIPSSPEASRQRLIFRGKVVMRDDASLSDVFGKDTIHQSQSQSLHLVLRELGGHTNQSPDDACQLNPTRTLTTPHQPYRWNPYLHTERYPDQPNEPTNGFQAAPQSGFPDNVQDAKKDDSKYSQPERKTTQTISGHLKAFREQKVDLARNHNSGGSSTPTTPSTSDIQHPRSSSIFDYYNQANNRANWGSSIPQHNNEQKFARASRQEMQYNSYIPTRPPGNLGPLTLKLEALQAEVESIEAILRVASTENSQLSYINALQSRHRGLAQKIRDLTNEMTNAFHDHNAIFNQLNTKNNVLVQDFLRQLQQQKDLMYGPGKIGDSNTSEAKGSQDSSSLQAAFLVQNHDGPYAIVYSGNKTYISPQRSQQFPRIDPNLILRNRAGSLITANTGLPSGSRTTTLPMNITQQRQNPPQNRNQNAENNGREEPNAEQGLQNIAGRLWLLVQTIGFIFLFGGSLGRTRQLIFLALSLLFHAAQLGLFGDRWARLRQHLEGLMPVVEGGGGRQRRRERRPRTGTRHGSTRSSRQEEARQQGDALNRPDPTPENTARRLVRQQQVRLWDTLTEQFRALERIVALFVATLWPGVGERHVAARRNAEAEAEAEANRENENRPAAEVAREPDQTPDEDLISGHEVHGSSPEAIAHKENRSGELQGEERTNSEIEKRNEGRS